MKRILSLVLVLCFVVALSACGKTDTPTNGDALSAPLGSVDGTTDTSSDSTSSADTESTAESGGGSNTESGTSSSNPPVTDVLPFYSELDGAAAMAASSQGADGLTADRILNFLSYELFHSYFYESDSVPRRSGQSPHRNGYPPGWLPASLRRRGPQKPPYSRDRPSSPFLR